MSSATLFTDGGARGNPGPAGIGYVLASEGKEPFLHGEYIGETTNNQAEYKALRAGLQKAIELGVTHVKCYLDSELVVKQMKKEYRVKHAELKPIYEEVSSLARSFAQISFTHVIRSKNKVADLLVNKAITKALA